MQVPKPKKKAKKKRVKLESFKTLTAKVDKAFSQFIRNRDAVELKGRCCTCGAEGNQAGHFIKRGHRAIRWNPHNCHLQCQRCNHYLDGNQDEYAKFIIDKYGLHEFHWLMQQKHKQRKYTREELKDIIRLCETATK